jgi:hypothetical protein
MSRPIELTGVVQGQTILLDERSFLPDGYRVKLHLVLEPAEALDLACGSWRDLTEEQMDDLERHLSEMRGRPVEVRADEEE